MPSLDTRLAELERTIWPPQTDGSRGDGLVLVFAVFTGRRGLPVENYLFIGSDGEPPADVAALGRCHVGRDMLDDLSARGYTVALVFDPARPYDERTPDEQTPDPDRPGWCWRWPALPDFTDEHVIPWNDGYTPGDCLRALETT
jgi:hypothetical protein